MRLVLVTDAFPPMRSSGAVQVRDLALELARQGNDVSVVAPSPELEVDFRLEKLHDVQVIRIKVPQFRNISYARRALNEALMPVYVLFRLHKHRLHRIPWDGVVCYAPSLFLGPITMALTRVSHCPSYLIIRDIFPQWALDLGMMGKGLPYYMLKLVEMYLYAASDAIGVQAPANLPYFSGWLKRKQGRKLEVLQNWLSKADAQGCSISIAATSVSGRKIFVYAGNMGRAQGMDIIIDLAESLVNDTSVGFLFVGRGSEFDRLRSMCNRRILSNVLIFDEIDPEEIPGLYAQCHCGLVVLDPRHKTHNIPGKFLSYMQSGLPVLAAINPGNDLMELIRAKRLGLAFTDANIASLQNGVYTLLQWLETDSEISLRCKKLWREMFSAEAAAKQVIGAVADMKDYRL